MSVIDGSARTSKSQAGSNSVPCVYRKPHSIEEEGESRKLIG